MVSSPPQLVLILGAGINGCAAARELVLNGVPVCLVDAADIAFGATSRSSRLIHGGLRYLEYREFDLVRESLQERGRLLRLAPQYVQPLRLFIPVRNCFGGLPTTAARFLGLKEQWFSTPVERGLWIVRLGLWLYDTYARDPLLPRHQVYALGDSAIPQVDATKYRWVCAYWDAQMLYPERFVLALLEDARRLAAEKGIPLQVFTYHRAVLKGRTVVIYSNQGAGPVLSFQPSGIINATGAWGDATLWQLGVRSKRLFGGTKGSHFLTRKEQLRQALHGQAVYSEAADGRLVFLLPLGDNVLVGTTDIPFQESPEQAIASPEELAYLLRLVNSVFPQVRLTPNDIEMHYSGVRPLPYRTGTAPAAITRRHYIEKSEANGVPLFTLVGGKLTTCRLLAEQVTDLILDRLHLPRIASSRQRVIPGGENYPPDAEALQKAWDHLAQKWKLEKAQVQAIWSLCGTRTEAILAEAGADPRESLPGTLLPLAFVRWVIRQEWVTSLSDLIERRLMLLYQPSLSESCLRRLADLLVEAGLLKPAAMEEQIQSTVERLRVYYGKVVAKDQ